MNKRNARAGDEVKSVLGHSNDGKRDNPGNAGHNGSAGRKKLISKFTVCMVFCVLWVLGVMYGCASTSDGSEVTVDWGTLHTYGDLTEEATKIEVQTVNNENILVLPATALPEAVSFFFDIPDSVKVSVVGDLKSTQIRSGDQVDLTTLCSEGHYDLKLEAKMGRVISEYAFTLSFADQIGTMYLLSEDAENKGRVWVESSPDKSNKATGHMILQNADGSVVYHDSLTQIKGRGNSTWKSDKKPYQIKLSTKTDLLQTGSEDNETKTWVLLANYADLTVMRNTLIYNLGRELGMEFCTENHWINLYYDGEYRGCYLLSEKVEIDSGRVDITDLEELNEDANEGVDFEELPVETGKTSNGATYLYCASMNSPEDITGGYLLEMEIYTRVEAEVCYFTTSRGQNVVVKSPEYASKEEMDYIASLYQEWEDAIYNGGVNPTTGKQHTEYVDLRSAAICYLANEISKNQDGFRTSAFFYKDNDDDMMYMGPLWDYDVTLNFNGSMRPTGFDTARAGLGAALCELGDFREAVRKVYLEEVYPLMTNVVLGEEDAVSLKNEIRSIRYYDALLSDSMACNSLLWPNTKEWKQEVTQLWDFLSERAEYLRDEISKWSADADFVLPESLFADVDENAWYFEDVHKAAQYGLMAGGGGDAFYPTQNAIRAHVIQTIYNMVGRPSVEYCDAFIDVKQHDEHANAVSWGIQNGVLVESPDGIFEPKEQTPREEVIVYLYRYLGSPEVDGDKLNEFADADAVSDDARNAMEWAAEADLLVVEDGRIRPADAVTRAELASILVRFYERFMKN